MLVELRVQAAVTWIPGQGLPDDTVLEFDRDGSPLPQPVDPDYHYRDDFAGKIDSIRPLTDMKAATLRNMSSKDWRVVVLDLDDETLLAVRSGSLKIIRGELVPVTFEDHFGAIAAQLREQHNDPEQWERDEETRIEDQRAENKTRRIEYDRIVEEYRVLVETFPKDLHEWSLNPVGIPPAYPEKPKALRLIEETPSSFEMEVLSLARALPLTMTHTGTGMYWVKKIPTLRNDTQVGAPAGQVVTLNTGGLGANAFIGGYISNTTRAEIRAIVSHNAGDATLEGNLANWQAGDVLEVYDAWSTWAAALAQLFTDQGAGVFTAIQYVRGFAGTYDEAVAPNATLNPDENDGFLLILEGDPTVNRSNIIIDPAVGIAILIALDSAVVRHLTCTGNTTSDVIDITTHCIWVHVSDCALTAISREAIESEADITIVTDCALASFDHTITLGNDTDGTIRRCTFTARGGQVDEAIWVNSAHTAVIESCEFSGFATGIYVATSEANLDARNNSFYNCTWGIRFISRSHPLVLINNIFLSCTTNMKIYAWPDETGEGSIAAPVIMLNNSFYDYINFAENAAAATRTYAQVIAMDGVTASDNADGVDPDLIAPGAGNFTPNVGSPVIKAGHGSGVVSDVNGDAFDPYTPDIGSVSTGVVPTDAAPTWAANTSNIVATDAALDGEVNLTWDAATPDASGSVGYIIESQLTAAPGTWAEYSRVIVNGTALNPFVVAGLVNTTSYDFRVKTYTRVATEPTTTPVDTDSATPTSSAPALPTDPTISVVAVDGLTVTVTITGDAGATYRVRLMDGADTEEDEDGRVGPGDIVLTALGTGLRYLIAWGTVGIYATEPTNVYLLIIPDTSDDGIAYYRVIDIIGMPGTPYRRLTLERTERPVIA